MDSIDCFIDQDYQLLVEGDTGLLTMQHTSDCKHSLSSGDLVQNGDSYLHVGPCIHLCLRVRLSFRLLVSCNFTMEGLGGVVVTNYMVVFP